MRTLADDLKKIMLIVFIVGILLISVLLIGGRILREPYNIAKTQEALIVNQALTQQAKTDELSTRATAESASGYNTKSNITINDSNCVAIGIEGNTQSVNCNITPQP